LIERYLAEVTELSDSFLQFVGESLSLPPDTLKPFLGSMHRLKLVKYPPATPGSTGVGPHKDSTGLFTFLSQDSVGGLQVLSKAGAWIDAPPIDGSLVVNVQQGFEAITGGICPATTHRVLVSPQDFILPSPGRNADCAAAVSRQSTRLGTVYHSFRG
jgi:isopenicillin N synthase-like dioxygenase